jgi:hypothetical protein
VLGKIGRKGRRTGREIEGISGFLLSAEFRKIDDLIEQLLLFREETHKFCWEILSTLFKKPGPTLQDRVKRYSKDQASDPNTEYA